MRQDDPLFNKWWTSFTVNQQRALLAVIKQKGRGLCASRVEKKSGLRSSTMQQAVKALVERDILREEAEGSVTILRSEDTFFKNWIEFVLAEGK